MPHQRFFPNPQQLQLLKFCLAQNSGEALAAWKTWRAGIDLDDLDESCFRIMSLVYRRMADLKIEDPDLARIKGIHRYHWTRNQLAWHGKDTVMRALRDRGISTLLLKGAALSRTVYAEPTTRAMHDLDILVPIASAAGAITLLEELGWKAQHCDVLCTIDKMHACSFLHPEFGEIDMHWHVLRSRCQDELDDAMWRDARDFSFAGIPTKILCPADQLLHACEHGMHPSPASALQWLVDATFIIRNSPAPFDWRRLIDRARKAQLILPVRNSLRFIRDQFEPSIPREVLVELDAVAVSTLERVEYFLAGRSEEDQAGLTHRLGVAFCHFLKLEKGASWKEVLFCFIPYFRLLNQDKRPWSMLVRDEFFRLARLTQENCAELGFRLARAFRFKSMPVGGLITRWPQSKLHGFFPVESRYSPPFRWTRSEAMVDVPLQMKPHVLRLQLRPFRDLERLLDDGLTLSVNGRTVPGAQYRISGGGKFLLCPIDAAWLNPNAKWQRLSWSIRPLTAPGDPRELGLPVTRLWVYRDVLDGGRSVAGDFQSGLLALSWVGALWPGDC